MDMYQKREQRRKNKEDNQSNVSANANINWYPGHMRKAENEIKSILKYIDIVLEVLDARIPFASQSLNILNTFGDKKVVLILNKADLADDDSVKKIADMYKQKNIDVIACNTQNKKDIENIKARIRSIGKVIYTEKYKNKKVDINAVYKVLIVGIPNVGKSTLINKLSNKTSAKVSNTPGVTRKNLWLKADKDIEILDTPGILSPKFAEDVGMKLALTGNIKQDIVDPEELAVRGIKFLLESTKYRRMLFEKYNIDDKEMESKYSDDEIKEYTLLKEIGIKRGCLKKGGVDTVKAANVFLNDFKSGSIGKMSLE